MFIYLDTSALAKWYLNEAGSEIFSEWVQQQDDVHISRLTAVEFRCLLARRRRAGELKAEMEGHVYATFLDDVEQGHLRLHALRDEQAAKALTLLERLTTIPLRSLDAMHLSIAQDIGAKGLATADQTMIKAGERLGLTVHRFDL